VSPRAKLLLGGVSLPVWPGRRLVARVVRVDGARAVVNLAGEDLEVAVAPHVRLRPHDTVGLVVEQVAEDRLALRLDTT
jgi:hypothetical protein